MKRFPRVVIVGRVNVGKSTLFNRFSKNVKSIILDYEGVTRDFLKDVVYWQNQCFELIDTGGVSLKKTTDVILDASRKIALSLLESADLILFICDGIVGLTIDDRDISKLLHRLGKNVLLVVNKMDSSKASLHVHEFVKLDHKGMFNISAQHGTGIGELLEFIVQSLPKSVSAKKAGEVSCKVVLLGKPNVGKSSLMNLLIKEERVIVSEVPGTTREPISENIKFCQGDIQITDTAGVRKKRAVREELETLMVKTTFRALENANIVLLLVDASEGKLSDQELKLAFYVFENHKALIVLFNKSDLVTEDNKKQLKFNLEPYEYFMNKLEILEISCKTGKNVGKILPKIQKVYERNLQKFSDDELTVICKEALARRPLFHKKEPLSVRKVRQISTSPVTLLIVANEPKWFGRSQLGFFDNQIRRNFDLKGVPIKFLVRKR